MAVMSGKSNRYEIFCGKLVFQVSHAKTFIPDPINTVSGGGLEPTKLKDDTR